MPEVVLLKLGDVFWAVPAEAVTEVRADAGRPTVRLRDTTLVGDGMPTLVRDLNLRPPGNILSRFWTTRCTGLATFEGLSVVAIDVARPPSCLVDKEGEASDAG